MSYAIHPPISPVLVYNRPIMKGDREAGLQDSVLKGRVGHHLPMEANNN